MRYSLSSRFRATFLGVSLEQIHATRVNAVANTSGQTQREYTSEPERSWERVAMILTRRIIASGSFNNSDPPLFDSTVPSVTAKAIVATLPLALFYHDRQNKLRQSLAQFALWLDNSEIAAGSLAVGYAIAASLREQLRITTILPQIITFIDEPHLQITHQLAQVQSLLKHQASLAKATSVLGNQPSSAIALAFYCFLSTPHDLQLSVRRAAISDQSSAVGAIAGALSGAYNGISGIPTHWQLALARADDLFAAWGCQNQAEILSLCDSLVTVWSGAYHHPNKVHKLLPATAVAAPRVIRPR